MTRLRKILNDQAGVMKANGVNSFRARASFAELDAIYSSHNGACDICGSRPGKLHLDHCHTTGKYRGLLCKPCNLALGHFRDNVDALRRAIDYLTK